MRGPRRSTTGPRRAEEDEMSISRNSENPHFHSVRSYIVEALDPDGHITGTEDAADLYAELERGYGEPLDCTVEDLAEYIEEIREASEPVTVPCSSCHRDTHHTKLIEGECYDCRKGARR